MKTIFLLSNRKLLASILVALSLVLICFVSGCSNRDSEPAKETQAEEVQEKEVIYADDSAINDFLLQYNSVYPNDQITSESVSKYHHHGSDHDNQIQIKINGLTVTISSEGYKGSNGISVYFDSARKADEAVTTNREMFGIILKALDPSLIEDQIEEDWKKVIEGASSTKLSDGIEVWPGPHSYDVPGSYGYMKIYKR